MARKTRGIKDVYTGRGGHRAVMAELLLRQCNVAIPEVDVGEDVFAFRDGQVAVARIQVKTARTRRYATRTGYPARFGIPVRQLKQPRSSELYYALAARLEDGWGDFLIISRTRLNELWNSGQPFGRENAASGNLELDLVFEPGPIWCGEVDLQDHRNAWEHLPPLLPSAAPAAAVPPAAAEPGPPPGTPPQP
jgi:hypothetical protein